MARKKRKKAPRRKGPYLSASPPLEMRRHPGSTHISLARGAAPRFVELADDLAMDVTGKQADDLRYDAAASSDPWSPGATKLRTLTDPQRGLLLAGERHLAWFDPAAGRFIPVPGVQWHLAEAAESISPGGSGTVTVWFVNEDDEEAASANEVTAYDWLGQGADTGARLLVIQHLQSARWYIVAVDSTSSGQACPLIEVGLGTEATPASLSGTTAVPIPFDEVGVNRGDVFALSGAGSPGEVSVLAAGIAEVYHHDAALTESAAAGDNMTEWWIERKSAAATSFSVIEETITRLYHPLLNDGRQTGFLKHVMELAYGDTLRVQARRLAGSDTLVTETLAGGGPTNFLGVHLLCHADTHDHGIELTTVTGTPFEPYSGTTETPPSGPPYYPRSGTGDRRLKVAAYYRLDETGSTDDRADASGHARDLRVLNLSATIPGVAGHVTTAAQIDGASEWLNRGAFGDPNPETDFRPASQMVSVAFWITLNSVSGVTVAGTYLVGLRNDNSWRVVIDPSGNISAIAGQTGVGAPSAEATVAAAPTDLPLLVLATFEGLAGRATLRVVAADRSFDHSDSDRVAAPTGWGAAPVAWRLDIGSSTPSTFAEFTIEQLGIWFDGVLTPREQDYLFAAGAGRQIF